MGTGLETLGTSMQRHLDVGCSGDLTQWNVMRWRFDAVDVMRWRFDAVDVDAVEM